MTNQLYLLTAKLRKKKVINILLICTFRLLCPVHPIFRFSYFGQNDKKQKNQLCCLCLKMTADFGNFVTKTDEKRKVKNVMKETLVSFFNNCKASFETLREGKMQI